MFDSNLVHSLYVIVHEQRNVSRHTYPVVQFPVNVTKYM